MAASQGHQIGIRHLPMAPDCAQIDVGIGHTTIPELPALDAVHMLEDALRVPCWISDSNRVTNESALRHGI